LVVAEDQELASPLAQLLALLAEAAVVEEAEEEVVVAEVVVEGEEVVEVEVEAEEAGALWVVEVRA